MKKTLRFHTDSEAGRVEVTALVPEGGAAAASQVELVTINLLGDAVVTEADLEPAMAERLKTEAVGRVPQDEIVDGPVDLPPEGDDADDIPW